MGNKQNYSQNPREKIHVPRREEIHQFTKRKEVGIDVLATTVALVPVITICGNVYLT